VLALIEGGRRVSFSKAWNSLLVDDGVRAYTV
jgi:hypothetical protein